MTNTTLAARPLGRSGIPITPVGFGAWAIAGQGWGFGWGPQDDADSVAAVHAAVEAGVSWIDTAPIYGAGHSEEVVGRALRALPAADRPLVFTKCGLVSDDPFGPVRKTMHPDVVRRDLEASLRRLGVDAIDLYQVHWPGDGELLGGVGDLGGSRLATPVEDYWQLMADLRAEGKIRAIGLSNHDVALLDRAEAIAHVDAIQPPFSAIHRGAAPEIAWAAAHDTGVIAYSPMASGLLSGAFDVGRVASLPADDWRRAHPDFTDRLAANLLVADALRTVAARHDVPVATVAVAWVLAWPGVTGAIVGARRADQVAGWTPAADLRLTADDLDTITAALAGSGAGEGPLRPAA
ncbi:aldo/keto reductase [Cryptosporangium aurantiacum]|uniref:Predicted oxidoreductase n=1 Tax=Cryptosporangium aurantiacum TaxID=134849 RepID=A0A1M7RG54_9ACTN|nr:aldo/keto reductase [Cryptosporangium aurantiacum]SHN45234.1 Predicted oxidoreductase [Cryptosporangium aurantiacum]